MSNVLIVLAPINVLVSHISYIAPYVKRSTGRTLKLFIGVSQVTVVTSGQDYMENALRGRMETMHLQNTWKSTTLRGCETKERGKNLQKLFYAPDMGSGEDIWIQGQRPNIILNSWSEWCQPTIDRIVVTREM